MAHEVRVKIDTTIVAHKDFEIIVKSDAGKIGTLLISKGNIEWLPKGNSVNKNRLSWEKFSKFMSDYGKSVKSSK